VLTVLVRDVVGEACVSLSVEGEACVSLSVEGEACVSLSVEKEKERRGEGEACVSLSVEKEKERRGAAARQRHGSLYSDAKKLRIVMFRFGGGDRNWDLNEARHTLSRRTCRFPRKREIGGRRETAA
jgi:hypothetical protein